jgi:hypothetical protein
MDGRPPRYFQSSVARIVSEKLTMWLLPGIMDITESHDPLSLEAVAADESRFDNRASRGTYRSAISAGSGSTRRRYLRHHTNQANIGQPPHRGPGVGFHPSRLLYRLCSAARNVEAAVVVPAPVWRLRLHSVGQRDIEESDPHRAAGATVHLTRNPLVLVICIPRRNWR